MWAILLGLVAICQPAGTYAHDQGPLPREMTIEQIKEMMNMKVGPIPSDCNQNGIGDAIDLRRGWDDDRNRNGQIDWCDSDSTVRRLAKTDQSWRGFATSSDSSYFCVRYRELMPGHNSAYGIQIRYTIPRGKAMVKLMARSVASSKIDTMLVSPREQSGAIELSWDRRLHGKYAPSGEYRFTLQVGSRVYRRGLAWAE